MRSGTSERLGGSLSVPASVEMSSGLLRNHFVSVSQAAILTDICRVDTGIPGYNGQRHMGCYPYWNGQDLWGVRQNAAVNAIYFSGHLEKRLLHVPSLSITMSRR